MPCKRRSNVVQSDTEEEEDDPEIVETAAPPRARRQLRRAGNPQDAEDVIDLSGSPVKPEGTSGGAAAHGVAAVSTDATQPGFTECTPQRRAPLCTPPVVKPSAIDAPRQRRSSRRQLGVYSSKQAGARDAALARLCRLRSGGGHANSAENEEQGAASSDGDDSDGGSGGSSRSSGSGGDSEEEGREGLRHGADSSRQSAGSEEGDDDEMADFLVEDDGKALAMLRDTLRGAELNGRDRHRLYCQLRLLYVLDGLPEGDPAVPEADRSCITRAAEGVERELRQFSEQANNLEGWRRADGPNVSGLSLKERFEQFPVVEAEEGGWHWGRHCAYCRHKRSKRIRMLRLLFSGQPSPVGWLVPELRRRGLLHREGQPGIMHGVFAQMGAPSANEAGEDDCLSEGSSEQSEGEEEEEEGSRSGEDCRRGGSLRREQQQPARKRRRLVARLFDSDEEQQLSQQQQEQQQQQQQDERTEEEEAPVSGIRRRRDGRHRSASSDEWVPGQEEGQDGSEDEDEDLQSDGERQDSSGEEDSEGESDEDAEPDSDDSDASGASEAPARNPRLHPRVGVDCWARAFVYGSTFRYPARLDAMLMWCTRDFLRITPEAQQPGDVAGLAAAVVWRYGRLLWRHYSNFVYTLNSFNLLQNKQSNRTAGDIRIVEELQRCLYCEDTHLTDEEQQQGVNADDELEAWAALCAERQAMAGGSAGSGPATNGLQLLMPGPVSWGEDDAEGDERVQGLGSEEEAEEVRRRRQPGRGSKGARHRNRERQLMHKPPAMPQGGQRAAAAVAAAYGAYAGSQQQPQTQQPGQDQQRRNSSTACFKCGKEGHWAADCPQGSARSGKCFKCGKPGHWSSECPQRGNCFACGGAGHWASNCPGRSSRY